MPGLLQILLCHECPFYFQLVKHGWKRGFSFACSSVAKYQRLDFGKKNYTNSLLRRDLQSTSSMIVRQASLCSILYSTFSWGVTVIEMDLQNQLASFRMAELEDVLSCLGLSKQGRKQVCPHSHFKLSC